MAAIGHLASLKTAMQATQGIQLFLIALLGSSCADGSMKDHQT